MLHILYKIKFDSASHWKVITVYLQTELCQNIWKEELMKSYFNYKNDIPKLSILEIKQWENNHDINEKHMMIFLACVLHIML